MTTFKQFLLTESRTQEIDLDQAVQFAQQHCQQYLQNGNYLYRGIPEDVQALRGDSNSSDPRVAKEIPNYYNLIMSNLPSWQQIPRRDQSFICSTDVRGTRNYGDPFLTLIPDDAKVAIFHARDIWKGTTNTQKVLDVDLDTVAFAIERIHQYIDTDYTSQQTSHNFNYMIDFLNQASNHVDQLSHKEGIIERTAVKILGLIRQEGALDTLQYLFDPSDSVTMYTASNIANIDQNREAWFSGPAVFINVSDKHPHPREFIKQVL